MASDPKQSSSMINKKPYRTKAQKEDARASAVKCEDGTWRSNAPVSYHGQQRRGKD